MREHWVEVSLGELVTQRKEKVTPTPDSTLQFLGMDCLDSFSISPRFFHDFSSFKSDGNRFYRGDILYGRLRPYLNKVTKAKIDGAASGEFIVLRPSSAVDATFALLVIHSRKFVDFAMSQVSGDRPRIKFDQISSFPFLLPPLPEQRAIVSKLEGLFSELDNGIAELKRAQEKLKVYRQSVLKKAFEGALTKEWRAKQTDLLTGEELLDQIKEERARYYAEQLEEWKAAVKDWESAGKPGKKPSKPGSFDWKTKEGPNELSVPTEEGWTYTSSGNLFTYVTSGSRGWAKYYAEGGGVFIRITNLNWNTLDLDLGPGKVIYVDAPKGSEGVRTRVQSGDFLFSITGDLGMFAIAPDLEEGYVNQHVSLARPLPSLNREFVGYWVISKSGGVKYLNNKSKGATKAGLGLDDIKGFPVPLCSRKEQFEVVHQIQRRLQACDRTQEEIDGNLKRIELLKQSILKRAFEGELLNESELNRCRQEVDWCPASELLERVAEMQQVKQTHKL